MHRNEHNQPIGFPLDDWTQADLPTRDSMTGDCVILQCVTDTEPCVALYNAYSNDKKGLAWTYLPYGPFKDQATFTQWFEQTCFGDDPFFHVVRRKDTNEAIGLASFLRINPDAGSIEIGHIHFSPLLQQTTMATEAMYLMMKRVFDELGYRRYEWKCDALNEPSIQAAKRLGFTYEGTFRQAAIYKQRNRDTAWFSITDHEWPGIKDSFEQWLAPANFDDGGRQIRSLSSYF